MDQHCPTLRPSVERTAEKSFFLSHRVQLVSEKTRVKEIKGGSVGVGEGVPTGSHAH